MSPEFDLDFRAELRTHLGLEPEQPLPCTISVRIASDLAGVSPATGYREARRFVDTEGTEGGIPALKFTGRSLRVPLVPFLRRLGVIGSDEVPEPPKSWPHDPTRLQPVTSDELRGRRVHPSTNTPGVPGNRPG